MNIKKIIKFSFISIIILVFLIASINFVVLEKNKKNNISKNYISAIISIQNNMNNILVDALLVEDLVSLEKIEKLFFEEEKKFEEEKEKEIVNNTESFFNKFVSNIYENEIVHEELNSLYTNEKIIEEAFDKIYKLQKKKIEIKELFNKSYPLENNIRKSLQDSIWESDNIELIKDYSDLKYYSKEALYQYKNKRTLSKWIEKAELLKEKINFLKWEEYILVVKNLTAYILELQEIESDEAKLTQQIQKIIVNNSILNKSIENKTQEILENFIKSNNSNLIFILIITIIFVLTVVYKVNKNISLSVDEIEEKVEKGIKEISLLNKEIETTQKEVVFTMGAIGETRSKETGNHVKRVAEYSKLFALYYGLDANEAEMLKQASPMHDIGKVAIPDYILNKPGPFNDEERKIMNTHARIGYEMLNSSNRPLLKAAAVVAYEHHEKYNGKGYPQGLAGEDIHIYGRITAIADVFDALGSDRCYKKAWVDDKIFKLFKEERGEHFDPKLVDIFFEHLGEFLKIRNTFKDV
ncbi:MAG: HD family phosphohydrolase [Arcobacter sp.]|nr:MAG: HD family phosphohydrolase [Arcobacter sp.]